MKRLFTFNFLFLLLAGLTVLTGCSHSSSSGETESETLVTKYTYNLTYSDSYYRVNEFTCVDNGDDTYDVRANIIHYFSISNSNYTDRTGSELCDMARTRAFSPSSKESYTLSRDVTYTISSGAVFYLPAGLEYQVWYYF